MTHLTRLSLANRLIVGLVAVAILVFGVLSIFALKQELLPSIQAPTALVTARYPGASPQIVAKDVSTPIENAVKAVSGVTKVSSRSSNSVAVITVEWDYGLDADKLVSNIRGALDSTKTTLPDAVETDVATGNTSDIPVLQLAVASDAPLTKAGQTVDNVAVPQLSAINGVRQVVLTGENSTRLGITLRPKDLRKHDLTAQVVTQSLQAQTAIVPAGTSYDKSTELAVEVGNDLESTKQVRAIPIATADGPVKLDRLATVKVENVDATSIARSDGRPALSLTVLKDTDADAVQISHAVRDQLPDLERKLGNHTTIAVVFDQAPLIEQSIHDLAVEGGLGLVFAVLVILLFLLAVRPTLITAISIPLSLLIAMIGLRVGGYSLNIFTLAALTVAVGRVVDDSIVIIENIKRRSLGQPDLTPTDIVAAVKEVAGAVTASTLTTIAVFLPVAVVSGITGELFRPFAVTVSIALGASLLVSMTIVPVLAYWFLHGRRRHAAAVAARGAATDEAVRVTRLQRGYLPVLRLGLHHPVITLVVAVLVFAGTLGGSTLLKTDFLGSFSDEHTLQIAEELPAGTRLETTSDTAEKVEAVLADSSEVKDYLTTVGGGGIPGVVGDSGTNTATVTVTLADGVVAADAKAPLQAKMDQIPKAGKLTVSTTDSGATNNDVIVVVSGDNSDTLRDGAASTQQLLKSVPGLADVRSDLADERNVLKVDVNRRKAADAGFTQAEIGQAVANALTGTKVGRVTLQGESRDILVRAEKTGATPADIAALELPVSQLQQQQAQTKATDKLKKKQEAASDKATAQAEKATADQQAELRTQRTKAANGLADAQAALRKLKANPPTPPAPPNPALAAAQQRYNQAITAYTAQLSAAILVVQATQTLVDAVPDGTEVPDPLQQRFDAAKKALATLQTNAPKPPPTPDVGALLAQQRYAQQVQQYAQQQAQLQGTVEQTKKTVSQLDDQVDQIAEQASKAADQRAEQQDLADEQAKLTDVRAKPLQVSDVATVKQVPAPTTVTQIDGTPSVTVTATPVGADLGALTKTIRQRLDTGDVLPAGVTATLGGSSQDQQDAFRQLGLAMLVAIALVFLIMVATFRSLVQPLILLVSIPFAATGALVGLLITGTPLGVPSMIGLLMLIGIVVTNAIVLIDLINQYRVRGEDVETAVIDGARLRLRPIIMTACATIFALIPMGLGLTGGGAFISQPLAVVVIGGLVSSTVLTLLLVPVLYLLVERRGERRRQRRAQRAATT